LQGLLPSPGFKTTGDKTRRAITVNKITIPGLIINHLLTLYREPANIQQTLYPDGKNHAVPSLHRDSFSAKVPGSVPGAASGNAYYHNRRAVSVHFEAVASQIRNPGFSLPDNLS